MLEGIEDGGPEREHIGDRSPVAAADRSGRLGQIDVLFGVIGRVGAQVQAEGRAARQQAVEEVDGEVAGDAAVREPAGHDRPVCLVVVDGVQPHRADKERKRQAHAGGDHNRQVRSQGQEPQPLIGVVRAAHLGLVGLPIEVLLGPVGFRAHLFDDPFREQPAEVPRAERQHPLIGGQSPGTPVRQVGGHHLQVDLAHGAQAQLLGDAEASVGLGSGPIVFGRLLAPEVGEGKRPVLVPGEFIEEIGQPAKSFDWKWWNLFWRFRRSQLPDSQWSATNRLDHDYRRLCVPFDECCLPAGYNFRARVSRIREWCIWNEHSDLMLKGH